MKDFWTVWITLLYIGMGFAAVIQVILKRALPLAERLNERIEAWMRKKGETWDKYLSWIRINLW